MSDKNKSSEIQVFSHFDFGEIRTIEENGKIYFCGKDVAIALGYKETQKAIREHCKGVSEMDTPHKGRNTKNEIIFQRVIYTAL